MKNIKHRIQRYILKVIFKQWLKQGYHHQRNLNEIQGLILKTLKKEFTEDTEYALAHMMKSSVEENVTKKTIQFSPAGKSFIKEFFKDFNRNYIN